MVLYWTNMIVNYAAMGVVSDICTSGTVNVILYNCSYTGRNNTGFRCLCKLETTYWTRNNIKDIALIKQEFIVQCELKRRGRCG